jgi:hypothetical protein
VRRPRRETGRRNVARLASAPGISDPTRRGLQVPRCRPARPSGILEGEAGSRAHGGPVRRALALGSGLASMDIEPLQTDEVDKFLREAGECALVHMPSGVQVVATNDSASERAPWRVSYLHHEILDRAILERALALGFELSAWPASSDPVYELSRTCFGVRAAAIKALLLARMLPGVPEDAWLWLTIVDGDQRDDPPTGPPSLWPPPA